MILGFFHPAAFETVMFFPTRADRPGCGRARGWKKSYHPGWRFCSFWRFHSFWCAAARPEVKTWAFPIWAEHELSACSPSFSDIDIVDHFSLNQSRTDEITLKEDDRNEFLTLADFGKKCFCSLSRLFSAFLFMLFALVSRWIKYRPYGAAGHEPAEPVSRRRRFWRRGQAMRTAR